MSLEFHFQQISSKLQQYPLWLYAFMNTYMSVALYTNGELRVL